MKTPKLHDPVISSNGQYVVPLCGYATSVEEAAKLRYVVHTAEKIGATIAAISNLIRSDTTCAKCKRRRHRIENPTKEQIRLARFAMLRAELSVERRDAAREALVMLEIGDLSKREIWNWAREGVQIKGAKRGAGKLERNTGAYAAIEKNFMHGEWIDNKR